MMPTEYECGEYDARADVRDGWVTAAMLRERGPDVLADEAQASQGEPERVEYWRGYRAALHAALAALAMG